MGVTTRDRMHGCERGCKSVGKKRHLSRSSEARGREAMDNGVCIPKLKEPKKKKAKEGNQQAIYNLSPKKKVRSVIYSLRRLRISLIHLIPWHVGHVIVLRVSILLRVVISLLIRCIVVHGRIHVLLRCGAGITVYLRSVVRRVVLWPRRRRLRFVNRARGA